MYFFITKDELAEAALIYRNHFAAEADQTCYVADRSCEGQFRIKSTMAADRWVDHGREPDWFFNPTDDLEYTWLLNRHHHFLDLGKAYLLTNRDKYVQSFILHVQSWNLQNPIPRELPYEEATYFQRPGPWRLLETGLRVQSWIWGYMLMQDSTAITQRFVAELKNSLIEHARFLSTYLGDCEINHTTMHMQGLYMIGTALEEHPEAPFWRQLAQERLELCLYRQIGDDGLQIELSTSYHNGSLHMFGTPYLLAKQRNRPFSEMYKQKLKSMIAYSCASIRPDGLSSPISDSDCDAVLERIGLMGAILEDEEVLTQGEIGEEVLWMLGGQRFNQWIGYAKQRKLELGTRVFPDAGYYIMRDENHYLLFDAASLGGAHGHADALSFEWMFRGCLLFSDPGRYTYQEGEWRRYFKGTSAHNTVTIDHMDQTRYISTQQWGEPEARVMLHRWQSREDYDFIDASHDGYTSLQQPVTHRRWLLLGKTLPFVIVVDWLEGTGRHYVEQNFQLTPEARIDLNLKNSQAEVVYSDEVCLRLNWSSSGLEEAVTEVKQGWMSTKYGHKETIPVLSNVGYFTDYAVHVVGCLPSELKGKSAEWKFEHFHIDRPQQSVTIELSNGDKHRKKVFIDTSELFLEGEE